MASEPSQTVGDLRRKAIVTDDEIEAAVDAYLSDPAAVPFRFCSGQLLNVAEALLAHPPSRLVYADVHARPMEKRRAVHAAVLCARLCT